MCCGFSETHLLEELGEQMEGSLHFPMTYIYRSMNFVDLYGFHVGKYASPMDPVGLTHQISHKTIGLRTLREQDRVNDDDDYLMGNRCESEANQNTRI